MIDGSASVQDYVDAVNEQQATAEGAAVTADVALDNANNAAEVAATASDQVAEIHEEQVEHAATLEGLNATCQLLTTQLAELKLISESQSSEIASLKVSILTLSEMIAATAAVATEAATAVEELETPAAEEEPSPMDTENKDNTEGEGSPMAVPESGDQTVQPDPEPQTRKRFLRESEKRTVYL